MQFENNIVYIDDKVGEDEVKDVQIFTMSESGRDYEQDITGNEANLLLTVKNSPTIQLFGCMIIDKNRLLNCFFNKKWNLNSYGKEFNKPISASVEI